MNKTVSILSDTGFKHLFGDEKNKEITIAFLNAYLRGERHVAKIDFLNPELQPDFIQGKRIVLDILCKDDEGASFNIEMQVSSHAHFKERILYYMCRHIGNQKIKGDDYKLLPSYTIALLNFNLQSRDVFNDYVIADKLTHKQFYKGFQITMVQLPRLKDKMLEEIIPDSSLKKWMEWIYLLSNYTAMETMPECLKHDPAMVQLWNQAQIDSLTEEQHKRYEEEMRIINDIIYTENRFKANLEAAKEEGREEGEAKKAKETALKMLADGEPLEKIIKYTGLTTEQISKLSR